MERIKRLVEDIWYWICELSPLWKMLAFALIGFIISEGLSSIIK